MLIVLCDGSNSATAPGAPRRCIFFLRTIPGIFLGMNDRLCSIIKAVCPEYARNPSDAPSPHNLFLAEADIPS